MEKATRTLKPPLDGNASKAEQLQNVPIRQMPLNPSGANNSTLAKRAILHLPPQLPPPISRLEVCTEIRTSPKSWSRSAPKRMLCPYSLAVLITVD